MSNVDYIAAARSDALRKAHRLPLADAIYEVVRHNHWASGFHDRYHIALDELSGKGSPVELKEWEKRSIKLRRDAYAVGDAGFRHDGTYDKTCADFVKKNPGFSEESYGSAISFGFQEAR